MPSTNSGRDFLAFLRRRKKTASPAKVRRRSPHTIECLEGRIAPAAALGVTKVYTFAAGGDLNSNGIYDPGDTILYTVTLTNSGTVDLTGVTFADIVDPNTTLGPNINVSPLAFNDTFTAVANTLLEVGVTHGAFPAAQTAGSVIANDVEFLGDTFTLSKLEAVSFSGGTATASSTQNGTVTMNAAGNFTYLPAAGFSGTDTFHYTITDKGLDGIAGNADDLTSVGTVTINVGAQKVWYVDNSYNPGVSGPSDGRSTHPFTSITATNLNGAGGAGDVDGAGDIIYIHRGTGAAYTGGIALEGNQTLHGQGEALTVGGFTLNAAGTAPLLTNVGGTIVALSNAGSNVNAIKGVTLGDSNIDIGGTGFGTLNITNTVSLNGTGKALDLTTGTLNATLADLTVTSSGTQGISLTGVDGSLTATSGSFAGITGDDIFISGGAANITLGISDVNTAGHSVNIAGKTSGTVTLNGSINDTGTGILLSSNTGAQIHFTGGITASTGASKAFSATGGGTIDVTGVNNTLATTTGTALEVVSTTISSTGLLFKSISANGGANGIFLDTTGNSGGLTVTGTVGSTTLDNSGGTIQNIFGADGATAGDGIYLNATNSVSLNHMNIHNVQGDGIHGNAVSGLTLTYTNMSANGNTTAQLGNFHGEGDVNLVTLSGSATVDHNNFQSAYYNTFGVFNDVTPVSLNRITMTSNTFGANDATGGNAGVVFRAIGGTMNVTFGSSAATANTITGAGSNTFIMDLHGTVSADLIMKNNAISNNHPNIVTGGGGVSLQSGGVGDQVTFTFNVDSNQFSGSHGAGFFIGTGQLTSVNNFSGTFSNNTIGFQLTANSGSTTGNDLFLDDEGGLMNVNITGNKLYQYNPNGTGALQLQVANDNGHEAQATFVVTGNTISNAGTNAAAQTYNGIQLNAGTTSGDTAKTNLTLYGNTVAGSGNASQGSADIRLRQRFNATVGLFGNGANYSGAPTDTTAIANFAVAQNGGTGSAVAGPSGGFFGTVRFLAFAPSADDVVVIPTASGSASGDGTTSTGAGPSSGGASTTGAGSPAGGNTPPPVIVDDGVLSQAELDSLVGAAIARWEATGLTPAQDALLHSVTFSVQDLPGWYLGEALPGHVVLDSNAAGNSWFIDPTPNDDSEFAGSHATANGGAAGRIDALTTVMHELGHQLGLDDSYVSADSGNLMYGFIHQSERRLPSAHQADGAVPHLVAGDMDFATLPVTIGTLPIGQNVSIQFTAQIKDTIAVRSVSNQGTGHSTETGDVLSNTAVTTVKLPDVNVVATTGTAAEGSGALVYTFTRTGITTAPLTVNFGASGTAASADYTATSSGSLNFGAGTVVIPVGSSSVTVTLTPVDDRLVEGSETATLTVNTGGYDITGTPASGTINDNDTAIVSFTAGTSTALESVGTQNVGVTLTLNTIGTGTIGLGSNFTANLTTTGGTATGSGTDYTLPGSPAVTFLSTADYSSGSATQNAAVTITDDRLVEGTETAVLGLAIVQNLGTQVSIGGTSAHTLTITDNDTATLGFTLASSSALESVGTQNVGVTLTLNTIGSGTIGLAGNLTANLTSTGGTALGGGTDYTLPGTPAVTFLAGTYASGTATQNAAVGITDDRLVEGSETAQLGLSIVGNIGTQVSLGGTTAHTLTITDNDTALIGFSAASSTVAEGAGSQNVTVLLTLNTIGTGTIGLASNLTANLTTTGGTATGGGVDYTLPGSPAVTFLAGTYATGTGTQIAAVGIVDDNLSEATETAQLGLSIVQNIGTQASIAGTTTHTLSITDNDPLPTISISNVTQLEGNTGNSPATSFVFNVSLSAVSGQTVTVHYSTTDGTATSPADFTAIGDTVLTFNPGDLTKTVTVLVNGDTITEPNEQFTVNLSNATAATILSGTGTGTIVDDDASLHAALDVSGNLTISDISSTGVDNALTVLLINSGASLQISDLTQVFDGVPTTSPASVLSNGGKTLTIPASAFTGNLALNTAGGNDTVTLDLTGGNFIHAGGVDFNGGNPTVSPGDKLIITGAAEGLVTYNHTNVSDGSIVMSTIGTVRYTGLEDGIVNSGTATDVTFNLPATNDIATFGDNGSTATDGLLRLGGSSGTFQQIDFGIPTNSLTINLGAGSDTFTHNATPQFTAGLTINGGTGDDTINLNGAVTFGLNKNLNVDLQDDSATPGIDTINVGAGSNYVLSGTGAAILRASKNILVSGTGHIATENGALNVEANQQATPTSGTFIGVQVSGTLEATGTGIVTVLGHGGDTGTANNGISIFTGGTIRGGSTGDSTIVTGTGGAGSAGTNVGVHVNGGVVQSLGGNILITGVGGAAGASGNGGIGILNGGQVVGGTNGNVILTGTKGAGTGNDIALATTGSTVLSSGTGNISLFADSLLIGTSGTTINAGANTVFLRQNTNTTPINIGSAGGPTPGLLEIANAELNRITAGTVQVGDANSGAITITAVISPLAYKTLSIGNAASFTSSGGFASDVNSATDYEKMLVAGALAIDPLAILSVTSAVYVPTASDAFIIINNTSAGTTTGAFNGKAEGSTVVVNGTNEQITYIGGAGSNDVILQGTTIAVTVGTTPVLESSTTGLVYTFTRVGDLTVALPVNFTAGGSATNTADYTATSSATTFNYAAGTFTMPAGVSTVTVTLVPVDDRIVEGSETAVLTVAAGSGYGVAGSPATGTIADNDTVTLSFTAGTSTALESVGTQLIGATITINAIGTGPIMLASNLTADLTTTGGTATGGGTDYTLPASPGVTFLAGTYATGTATQNFGLAVTDDRLVEGTETAQLGLAIAQNIGTQVSIGGTTAHTLTITDNDTATLGFTLGTSTALESVGTQNISTTLTINAIGTGTIGLASNLTADLTTTGGTATGSGTDYTLPGSPAVTFLAGTYATGTATQNAAVSITDDRLVEGSETAGLGLSIMQNIGTQVSVGGTTAHTLTITDNDTATLGFTLSTSTALESVGTQNISTTLTINAIGTGPIGLASNLTADLTTTGGTATGGGTDYSLPISPAVTFLAGTYATGTATQNAAVTITDDRLVEGTETAGLGLNIVGNIGTQVSLGGTTAHTLTITDNDTATLGFTLGSSSALESVGTQNISTTLTINAIGTGTIGLASNLTANLTTTGGTATGGGTDYTLPGSPAVTFLAGTYATGTATQNAAVSITDDRLVEGTETAGLGLSIVGNIGTQVTVGGTTAHTLTITDNDTATLGFTLGTSTALESVGTQNISTTLTINAIGTGTIGLASNLTADLTTTGGTATGSGTDYTLPGSPAVTFLAGTYATGTATQNAAVSITDDRLVEGSETAGLGLSIVGNIGTQVSVGGTTAHTLTITDNDTATLGFTLGTSTALESVGTQNISTTLTLNTIGTGPIGLASNLTADLTTTGGTATGGGTDYTLPGSPAVTFLAGTYATGTATQNAAVTITDDRLVEGTETAGLGLSIVGNIGTQVSVGGTTAHTLTITDNDTATLGFTLGTSSALESVGTQNIGTTLTINAIGTGTIGLASNLTANLTTTGGTANGGGTDYTLPGTPAVTFLAGTYATGTATQNAAVSITDDRLVEGDETAGLGLSIVGNIGTQVSLGGTTAHTLTITDNDTATLSFTAGTSTALESVGTQNISTTLTINAIGTGTIGLASNLTANLTATGGTATGGGTDYTLPGSPAVTFLAGTYATGTATQNAAVSITDDRLVEGSETAALGLSIVGNIGTQVSVGGTTAHTLTITDNDTATLSFTLGTSTALESVGTQNIGTTLTINAIGTGPIGLASNLTADLITTGGTASGGGTDYGVPGSPAVTFLAGTYATGTATQNAAVSITDDRLVEGSETAVLGLSIVGNIGTQVSVGGTTAHTLTITDNDTATVGFTLGTSTALESIGTQNIGTTLTINAIGTGPIGLASDLTVNLTTTGGTATGGGTDYTLPGTPAITFVAGTYATGTATQNGAVAITDDRLVEGTETAALGLSIVGNIGTQVSLGGTTAHTLTITDNDTATIGFTAGTSSALESVGTQNISTTLTINAIGTGRIGLASNLTANLTTTGGTATGGGTDYTLPGSPAVTFLAGTYATGTATQNGAVSVTDDRLVEGDETAVLGLSIVGNIGTQVSVGGTTAHTFTITDNDTATLSFTAGASTALESAGIQNIGTTLTINAIGTGPIGLASNLTADLTTTGGTALASGTDYTLPASPAVTFLAGTYATGTATQSAAVAITDDRLVEGTETAQLGLSIAGNIGAQVSVGGTAAHTLTITDNDTATLNLAAGTSTAVEGDGTHDIGVILTINAIGSGPIGLASDLTADLTTTGGTATGGADYTLPGSPAVTFAAGTYATGTGTQIAVVGITDDRLVEGTETAQLGLGITGNIGTQVSLGGTTVHTLTITDNDTATIGFATPTSNVTEGAGYDPLDLVLTITADGTGTPALAHDVTFIVTATGGTATGGGVDYTLPGVVTFSAGAHSGDIQTANLAITDDSIAEDVETAGLGLSLGNDGSGGQVTIATDATASHTTSITDNDIDLHVSGTHPNVSIVAGSGPENLTFTFTVQNNGFIDAHNVTLDEAFTLPTGTTLSSDSETLGSFDGTHWVIPTLAASGSATLTVNFTADHSTANNATATAVATVASAQESVVNTGDDSDLESATIIRQNDLSVKITDAPDPAAPNAGLTYTITVANAGPSDSTSGHFTDMFPAGLNAITWTADFSNNGGTGNVSGNGDIDETLSVPAGGSVVYTVHTTPDISIAGTTISDTAAISSAEDTYSQNDSFTEQTFIGGVDLHLTKTADSASETPGQVIKYTLAYHNGGYVTAAGVKITDLVPANTEFDLANSTAGWTDAMGNPLANNASAGTAASFSVGTVAVGNTDATVVFAVHVKSTVSAGAETIDNSATISDDGASGADLNLPDNTGAAHTTLVAAPDLVLTSDADSALIIRGQTLHTTYHYSNVGNQDAGDTTITATVPVGTHYNSLESAAWSQLDATHYAFDIASLPAGAAPGSVVFAVDVDTTRVAGLHEVDTTAKIDDGGANGADPTPTNNTVASTATKIYEGIYAVSQGIAVAGRFGTPTVHVYDPIDGHELYHFDAYESKLRTSVRVAVADINGDGFDDIITTIGTGTGRLRVFDGLTGTWLHDEASYTGPFKNEIAVFDGKTDKGAFVAAGDLNGDHHADIAVGSALGGGKVRVFDGLTGAAKTFGGSDTFFQPFGKTFKGGVRVAVGDVLGDSHADLVAGMGYYGAEVKVYDGNALDAFKPTVAGGFVPPPPVASLDFKVGAKTFRGGVSVALGDLNHDGKLDLIIGRNSGKPTVVEAFSGLLKDGNGNPLGIGSAIDPFDKNPLRPTYALGVRVAAIDVDFDGVADIIAASGGNNKSTVNIYSGADHHLIRTFTSLPMTPNSSLFVAGTEVSPVYHKVMVP